MTRQMEWKRIDRSDGSVEPEVEERLRMLVETDGNNWEAVKAQGKYFTQFAYYRLEE